MMGGSLGAVVDASGMVLDLLAVEFLVLLAVELLLDLFFSLGAFDFDFLAWGCSVEGSSSSNFFGFLARLPVTCTSSLPSAHHLSILMDLRDMVLRGLRNRSSQQWSYGRVDLQINNNNEATMEIC